MTRPQPVAARRAARGRRGRVVGNGGVALAPIIDVSSVADSLSFSMNGERPHATRHRNPSVSRLRWSEQLHFSQVGVGEFASPEVVWHPAPGLGPNHSVRTLSARRADGLRVNTPAVWRSVSAWPFCGPRPRASLRLFRALAPAKRSKYENDQKPAWSSPTRMNRECRRRFVAFI